MMFPAGVRTRVVTCGAPSPPIDVGPGQKFETRVKVTSSRGLIWNGEVITRVTDIPAINAVGGEVSFLAIVTDMEGMIDAESMQLIDISEGRHTHILTAKIKYYHQSRLVWEMVRDFVVPTDDEPLDLDSLINPDIELGILVPVPMISDQQVADAVEGYLEQNDLATPEYVSDAISEHAEAELPHPVYDEMLDLTLVFENGLV